MEADPKTKGYQAITELLPLILLVAMFMVIVLPFNFFDRSSRFFFFTCLFHCLGAPLYKDVKKRFLVQSDPAHLKLGLG
ncbi:unnamed protein product [Arabidopsis lyrata]|nr:unnamed protein product [Arabidopsis lyrata]